MKSMRVLAAAVALVIAAVGAARAEPGSLAPANAEKTFKSMYYLCWIGSLCPLTAQNYRVLEKAIGGDRDAQYLWGLTLLTGDGAPMDREGGTAWAVLAAQQGAPDAALYLQGRIRNGENIEVDEFKEAAALKKQPGAGDIDSMRALAPLYFRGRGVDQDPKAGLALLTRAAERGSAAAEADISNVYLYGAPGVAADRAEALRWLGKSAGHGNVDAMVSLGYMSMNAPIGARDVKTDLAAGYCWLVRAALLDNAQAQEKLSMMLAQGEHDDATVLAPDLVQADYWFRLAARSPYHNNSQIRSMIEPKMTSAQLAEAKAQLAKWHPLKFDTLRSVPITLPGPGARACPALA